MEDQSGQAESPAVEENKTKGEEVPQGHKDNQKENGDASKEDVEMDDSEAKDPKTLGGEDTSKVQKEDGNSETEKKESVKPPRSIEKEVGITQYVGTHEGFFGILKQR